MKKLLIGLLLSLCINANAQDSTYTVSDISAILENIMDADQGLREKLDSTFETYGGNSAEMALAIKNLNVGDSINQQLIDSIYSKYQWLTPPRVSQKASKAYFYVIQHASYEFQKRYKTDVFQAFEKGIIDSLEFWFFVDRLGIGEQKYQKYGTQIKIDNIGNHYFVPIDTTNNSASHFLESIEQEMKDKDFILFSNHNFVALFVHCFTIGTNTPSPVQDIYIDDKMIGKTDRGFFQTLLPRKTGELKLTIMNTDTDRKQSVKLEFDDQIDFFDNYFGL